MKLLEILAIYLLPSAVQAGFINQSLWQQKRSYNGYPLNAPQYGPIVLKEAYNNHPPIYNHASRNPAHNNVNNEQQHQQETFNSPCSEQQATPDSSGSEEYSDESDDSDYVEPTTNTATEQKPRVRPVIRLIDVVTPQRTKYSKKRKQLDTSSEKASTYVKHEDAAPRKPSNKKNKVKNNATKLYKKRLGNRKGKQNHRKTKAERQDLSMKRKQAAEIESELESDNGSRSPVLSESEEATSVLKDTRYGHDIFMRYAGPRRLTFGHIESGPKTFTRRLESLQAGQRHRGEVIWSDAKGGYGIQSWDLALGKD